MKIIKAIAGSATIQILLTVVLYSAYAALLGLSLSPSVFIIWRGVSRLLADGRWLAFSMLLGASLFVFFTAAVLVFGVAIRLLSWGVKPGKYPAQSLTVLRWLIHSGAYNLVIHYVLPLVPMSFLTNGFFRIVGCKMGRNVKLNTFMLNDAYFLTIGDNVVVGGQTDISCHLYENGHLILQPISIGADTIIGAHCYISPGVTIGKRCIIGLGSYIRKDRTIADDGRLTCIAAVPFATASRLEKGRIGL